MNITREECGWAGHFICADSCRFKRNTLLTNTDTNDRIVVSTVGGYVPKGKNKYEQIGCDRYFETMVFKAMFDDPYWDADVTQEISFQSKSALNVLDKTSDKLANDMHEAAVQEIMQKMSTRINL
jgi:hypothetical protein